MMSLEGEKSQELLLLDGSNYMFWCNSILYTLEVFDPLFFSIVDASICPLNFDWDEFSKEEGKCMQRNAQATCLLRKALSSSIEDMIIKEYGFLEDAHLLWNAIKEKFLEITAARDSIDGDCVTKPVRLVGQIGQTGLAHTETSKLQKSKSHRSIEESTSQTSSLSYESHGKCLMAKGNKKKKPKKIKSEKEEEDDDEEEEEEEYDLDFDKLSKKDMIKIKSLFEIIQELEFQLEQQEEYLIDKMEELKALNKEHEKLKHSHTSLISKHEKLEKKYACATNVVSCVAPLEEENVNLKTQLEVLTSKHV
jgi:hypothetical protein